MPPAVLLVVYCVLILLASLAGGWVPLVVRLTHRRMQVAVSLVAGVMLGVGLLHLLPHALLEAPEQMDRVLLWVLAGMLVMFFIERFFCYHHHDVPKIDGEGAAESAHGHEHDESCVHLRSDSHRLTWSGAAVGLTLHTIFAGIALAASVAVESSGGHVAALAGLGTFLVIFLHKPFDAMTITTLMTVGQWSGASKHLVNALFALMVPLGVVLFYLGLGFLGGSNVAAYALAFSAGTFLCIAMADLLPELHFHAHDRAALSVALLLGLSVAWVIGLVETQGHGHEHGHHHAPPGVESHEHHDEHGAGHERGE